MRVKNSTQRFQGFVQDLQESFWGDFQGQTREMLKKLLETDAEQQMANYLGLQWHERARPAERLDYRNGFYERDYVTPMGIVRLRIPRTRQRAFHQRPLGDDWAYVVLDGVWLKVRRAFGPQRVLLLVAYGIGRDGRRELLAFARAKRESQARWEGLLND